jgi:ABC-2 type transport system permease protein
MMKLLGIELFKFLRLSSLRFSLLVLLFFPPLWAYAPGIFEKYNVYLVSAYQVAALSLSSSMVFLLPLLVAITSAELLGVEMQYHTLPTILLRPVTRAQWLLAKLIIIVLYPFVFLTLLFLISLLVGAPLGYGSFVGGTGVGAAGLLGQGTMTPGAAFAELSRAYVLAGYSLIPVGLLSLLCTVIFRNVAAGALATLSTLIVMQLLDIFSWLKPFLLSQQLDIYLNYAQMSSKEVIIAFAAIGLYAAIFAVFSTVTFERRDF